MHTTMDTTRSVITNVSFEQKSCAICTVDYEINKMNECIVYKCKHIFHKECVLPWLEKSDCCPFCMKDKNILPLPLKGFITNSLKNLMENITEDIALTSYALTACHILNEAGLSLYSTLNEFISFDIYSFLANSNFSREDFHYLNSLEQSSNLETLPTSYFTDSQYQMMKIAVLSAAVAGRGVFYCLKGVKSYITTKSNVEFVNYMPSGQNKLN